MRIKVSGRTKLFLNYLFLIVLGLVLIYPLIWLFFASLKPSQEIFATVNLWPSKFDFSSYVKGWKSTGQVEFGTYFINSFELVIPVVLFTIISSILVAYGFARFKFPFRKIIFYIMLSTLMLPSTILIIPRYMLFRNLGWVNTYLPFIVPAIFACSSFFIYMFIQFFRGLPRELDESAIIDGCSSFKILLYIILPLSKPAIISAAIFQFIWTWNDFINQLIYINSVTKYTVALGLRMSLDSTDSYTQWNQILAMSVLAILPCTIIFLVLQKYFVEGIATTGIKG